MGATEDRIDLDTAARLLDGGKPRPMATCPHDGDPLVSTLEFPGAEFVCVKCSCTFGFLSPAPADPTPELEQRYAEACAVYEGEHRLRRAGLTPPTHHCPQR